MAATPAAKPSTPVNPPPKDENYEPIANFISEAKTKAYQANGRWHLGYIDIGVLEVGLIGEFSIGSTLMRIIDDDDCLIRFLHGVDGPQLVLVHGMDTRNLADGVSAPTGSYVFKIIGTQKIFDDKGAPARTVFHLQAFNRKQVWAGIGVDPDKPSNPK